ncbi:hypothetical protein IMSHALPRED_009013 [Imshaugia aleurites]|uniref:PD-(D/E)XK nuclease-like domain-containing protein n=1 Tax=Imshaugia aleurites TaxID=172621 RepID=A0A8H3ITH7_9LECA|nr:hypothetical protein IMSHALPRED_009013 [Imshaugia aleurites]
MIITIPGRYEFPRSVQPYIKNLVELEADKFIPMVLKSQIGEFIKASPKDISFFEQNWYGKPDRTSEKPYYEHPSTDIDTERMIRAFDALIEIQAMAKECDDDGKDENAWCQTVVLPLLRSALHKPDSSLWRVESVQTQTIETEFMPASISSSSGKSTDDVLPKMIDYAIFLNKISKDLDVVALYEAMKQVEGGGIGLWTDSYTNTLIPFAICAVKSEYAITMEGKVQLMTVAQAFLKYLEDLVIQASKLEIKDELLHSMPPVMGWTVHGHDWKFYICHRKGEQQIWADCSMGDGSTATPGKALRLLRVIEEIKKESGQQYVVWLKKVFNL